MAVAVALSLTGCGGDGGGGSTDTAGPTPGGPNMPAVVEVKREHPDGGTVKLAIGDEDLMSQLQGFVGTGRARVKIDSPANLTIVRTRRVGVAVSVSDFVLGEAAPGQHVRLVLDGEKQVVHTDPSRMAFFEDVDDGWHILSAMLCRQHRLALKSPGSAHQVAFYVQAGTVAPPDLEGPVLLYSQPTGDYSKSKGEAKAILIDFRVMNVELGEGQHTVRATLNRGQKVYTFREASPQVIIENLPVGTHTVELELLDPNGRVVDCPVRPCEGTFRIVE